MVTVRGAFFLRRRCNHDLTNELDQGRLIGAVQRIQDVFLETLDNRQQGLAHTQALLNNRPRKRLGFKTPKQVFHESLNRVALHT